MTHSKRNITPRAFALVCALTVIVGAGPVMAQFPSSSPPAPAERPSAPSVSSVEGTVKKVDPAGGKVEITSGLFGFFGRTLEVTPDTHILVEGRQRSLSDIREGDKVRAAYEVREGQSIAKAINVTPESRKGTAPSKAQ